VSGLEGSFSGLSGFSGGAIAGWTEARKSDAEEQELRNAEAEGIVFRLRLYSLLVFIISLCACGLILVPQCKRGWSTTVRPIKLGRVQM
jgi:hypothetical protein